MNYHHFDNQTWPLADGDLYDLENRLRYDHTAYRPVRLSRSEEKYLASVLRAYHELIWTTNARRNAIAKGLR
jgi:hypothetical protein